MKTQSYVLVNVLIPFEFHGFTCDVVVQIEACNPELSEFDIADFVNCQFGGIPTTFKKASDSFAAMMSVDLGSVIDENVSSKLTKPFLLEIVSDAIRDLMNKFK